MRSGARVGDLRVNLDAVAVVRRHMVDILQGCMSPCNPRPWLHHVMQLACMQARPRVFLVAVDYPWFRPAHRAQPLMEEPCLTRLASY